MTTLLRNSSLIAIFLVWCVGCASTASDDVMIMDFRNTSGAYILAYTEDLDIRTRFEDQLVADLAARDIKAWPSHPDIQEATATTREDVLSAANARQAMFVILAERVPPHGQAVAQTKRPERISHEHPDLREFYEHTRPDEAPVDADEEVWVEVSAYLVQGDRAKLFWTGTSWSFAADGEGGAIADISTTIANAIVRARAQFLAN